MDDMREFRTSYGRAFIRPASVTAVIESSAHADMDQAATAIHISGGGAFIVLATVEQVMTSLHPAAVSEDTMEVDTIQAFISECLETSIESKVSARDLYAAYERWCRKNGHIPRKVSPFLRVLPLQGITIDLGRIRNALNVRLREPE